jgi:hypothetical protein
LRPQTSVKPSIDSICILKGFTEVCGRKKKNVKKLTANLNIKKEEENNNLKDEGFATASPTESEESLEVRPIAENGSGEGSKTKNKKKRKKKSQNKNKNKPTCGYEASNEIGENENESQNETFYDKHVVHIVPQPGCQIGEVQHRRRRISSRCNSEGEEICPRSIHWAPELVLEPSRVRTS